MPKKRRVYPGQIRKNHLEEGLERAKRMVTVTMHSDNLGESGDILHGELVGLEPEDYVATIFALSALLGSTITEIANMHGRDPLEYWQEVLKSGF